MKKLTISLLAVLVLLSLAACSTKKEGDDPVVDAPKNLLEKIQEQGYITLGTSPDWPPYEFIDASKSGDERYVGADIELAKYIAEQLGVELRIKPLEFSGIFASIASKDIDMAISGLGYTEERDEVMDFTITYNPTEEDSNSYHGLMIRLEDKDKYEKLEDFEGLVIVAQNGSLQQGFVETQMPYATLKLIGSIGDGVMMLQTKAVDAMAITSETGAQQIQTNSDLYMTDIKFNVPDMGTLVGVPEGEKELLDAINLIIEDVLEQGLYQKWLEEALEYSKSIGIE